MTISRSLALAIAALLTACDAPAPAAKPQAPPPAAEPSAPPEIPRAEVLPVYKIDSMTFEVRESMPVQLVIKARGTVRTGGWSGGELRPLQTLVAEDGVRSFTFVGTAPRSDMMVTQALSPIEATVTIPILPADVKSIRIIAETNEMTEALP
jgi:hypothetical protein